MSGTLAPLGWWQPLDDSGLIMPGGLIYTYTAGGSVAATTYTDSDLLVPNANPIVLDAAGRCTIYLSEANYKFTLKTAAGVTLRTQDNIASVALITSATSALLWDFGGDPNSPVNSSSFPVGSTFDKFHAGTSFFTVNSTTIPTGVFKLTGMGASSSGSTVIELVNVTDAPDTLVASALVLSVTVGTSFTPLDSASFAAGTKTYGIKIKNTLGVGYAWGIKLVRVAS